MKKFFLAFMIFGSAAFGAKQESAPFFNASLIPDVAIYQRTTRIEGFTISFWGENEQSSFALGFVNGFRGDSSGFGWGLFNYADNYAGANLAIFNWAKKNFTGVQAGIAKYTEGTVHGAQLGAVNICKKLKGLQFGLVNFADSAESGIQIGFVNILLQNTWFSDFPKAVAPVMILANWRFI